MIFSCHGLPYEFLLMLGGARKLNKKEDDVKINLENEFLLSFALKNHIFQTFILSKKKTCATQRPIHSY